MNRITAIRYNDNWYDVLAYTPGYGYYTGDGTSEEQPPAWLIAQDSSTPGFATLLTWVPANKIQEVRYQ